MYYSDVRKETIKIEVNETYLHLRDDEDFLNLNHILLMSYFQEKDIVEKEICIHLDNYNPLEIEGLYGYILNYIINYNNFVICVDRIAIVLQHGIFRINFLYRVKPMNLFQKFKFNMGMPVIKIVNNTFIGERK